MVRLKEVASHGIVGRWHCFRFLRADLIVVGWSTVGAAEDGTEISVIPR